jgi:hypothetical protein
MKTKDLVLEGSGVLHVFEHPEVFARHRQYLAGVRLRRFL